MARTPKARALGAALRKAREEKGMLLREVAAKVDRDIGVLSRWETGDRTPKPEHVAQILAKLDVDGDRYAEIMTLAYGTNESQWVATTLPEQRQQMAAFLGWEQNAHRITEVPARIETRIGRRKAITKHNPAKLSALIGQGALNQEIGGRQVMIGQLRHLLEMGARPNVELRVVPDRRGWHPGLEGEFTLIEAPLIPAANGSAARREPTGTASIVFVGNRRTVLMLHEDADVAAYRTAIERILSVSLPPEKSAAFVAELIHRMEHYRG